jgi:putative ABC transport system permease protein
VTDLLLAVLGVLDLGVMQGLVLAGLALSVVVSLLVLDFPDLSIEGTFPLGAAVAAVLLTSGEPPVVALVAAGVAGACGGLLTSAVHVRFGMSKLLSGICTAAIFYTLNMWIMGGRGNLPVLDVGSYFTWAEALDASLKQRWYSSLNAFFHPASILAGLLVVILLKGASDFLLGSELGVVLRGIGQNEAAVRQRGRRTGAYKVVGLALSNAYAGIAGALAAQYQGFSDVNMGIGVLVLGLVGVILGQELFARLGIGLASPRATTLAALVGVTLHQVILAAALRAGTPPTSLRLLAGVSLVAVMALRRRRRALTFSW